MVQSIEIRCRVPRPNDVSCRYQSPSEDGQTANPGQFSDFPAGPACMGIIPQYREAGVETPAKQMERQGR
jgi:hypothetical protein